MVQSDRAATSHVRSNCIGDFYGKRIGNQTMNLTLSQGEELAPMSQSELFRQIHELSRNQRDHLLVLLQDDLDGGPYVGELREPPSEAANEVIEGWKGTIARRIDEMLDDFESGLTTRPSTVIRPCFNQALTRLRECCGNIFASTWSILSPPSGAGTVAASESSMAV